MTTICAHWIVSAPKTRVIQPIWQIAIFDKSGVEVVVYADDLMILVSGMFPSIMRDIMEGALGKVYLWCVRSGLGINPVKVELMLFTTKIRVPELHGPRLNEQSLVLSSNVKYLSVILDPKLNWG